jgi:hypothetical protein
MLSVSQDGHSLLGLGQWTDGQYGTFVMTLDVPEPASAVCLATASVGLLRRRRRPV